MESSIFWDITPCSPLKVNRRLGGTCCLHFQGRRISRARNEREAYVFVPATEHGHFVASWWRTPLRLPPEVTRFYFQQTSGIHAPVGKRKGGSLSGRSPSPTADSFHVTTMARKHSVLNLREISRNDTHTALASVLTYYWRVSLIFSFFVVTHRNII
jgi:hypothetical protein